MNVDLASLQPNPHRNYDIDPLDEEKIVDLMESIKEDGFWGGVVCRQIGKTIEIGAGHHRVAAALRAGIRTADLFVGDFDDDSMVRVYMRENATQRGNSGAALAGGVAAAVKRLAKRILTNSLTPEIRSKFDPAKLRGKLTGEYGIGEPIISLFLTGIPGITKNVVVQQLANLKASGDYAKIIAAVQAEIAREQHAALAALARAEKAQAEARERAQKAEAKRKKAAHAARAAKEEQQRQEAEYARQRAEAEAQLAEKWQREAEEDLKQFEDVKQTRDMAAEATTAAEKHSQVFDLQGVAQHLKNAHHIQVFRKRVLDPDIAYYLPIEQQREVAKEIVEKARKEKKELTGDFIEDSITALLVNAKEEARQISEAEKRALLRADTRRRFEHYQDDFIRYAHGLHGACVGLSEILNDPKAKTDLTLSLEFQDEMTMLTQKLNEFLAKVHETFRIKEGA